MAEPAASDGPYVGPRPFEPGERERFFGRDQEASALASLVVAHRVVVLYAASGAGKTSLLNAGLAPLLARDDEFEVLPVVRLRGLAVASASGNPYIANAIAALARELALATDHESPPSTLVDLLAACPRAQSPDDGMPVPRALIFDQFEELFTLYPESWQQRHEVFEQIADALEHDPLLRVVLAIREDYVAQLDPYASLLPDRLRTRMRLESLRRPQALAAVTEPLAGGPRRFSDGVAEQLVDDLLKVRVQTLRGESREVPGEFVEPVQLQVVCRTLWSSLPGDVEEIGAEELARVGSVSDVLADYYAQAVHAAAVAAGMPEPELRDRLETALITPVGTRGTVVGGDATTAGIPNVAIAELEERRLVRAEWRAGARWFELAHDSLIQPIVTTNAALRGARQARRERWLKQAIAGLMLLAVLLIGLLLTSRDDDGSSSSRRLGLIEGGGGPLKGLRLVRSFQATGSPVVLAPLAGGRGLLVGSSDGRIRVWDVNAGTEITTLDYGDSGLSSVAVRPDGRAVLAAGRIGVRRWEAANVGAAPPQGVRFTTLDRGGPLQDRTPVTGVAFDPAGIRLVVVEGGRAEVRFDDAMAQTGASPFASASVVRAIFSPAGTAVAGVVADGTARVRRVSPLGASELRALGHERRLRGPGSIVSAAFAPGGATFVTASDAGEATLWRARDGARLRRLRGGDAPLTDARFSPDGSRVATAGADGLVRVWTAAGERVAVLRASRGPISAVAFGGDGQMLATAAADGAVRVWANVVAKRAVASAATCSAADYYERPVSAGDRSARGDDGDRYAGSVACLVPAGGAVRAPEAGVVTRATPRGLPRVELTTPSGRQWVFVGSVPEAGLADGARVAAGARIGSIDAAGQQVVRIELWGRGSRGHRLANLWNPLLFLPPDPAVRALPYPGDGASKPDLAAWMGTGAAVAGIPPELPVMAALTESGLFNNPGGDRDSAGFFQMRLSIWNNGEYKGFATRPALQLKWFLDQAQSVRLGRLAQGRPDPAGDAARYGGWAADVTRPPAPYRGRFATRLDEARDLLGPLAHRAASVSPDGARIGPSPRASSACSGCKPGVGATALRAALSVRGTPYLWGGNSLATGFDTGGLVQWAYGRAGAQIPRVPYQQARIGQAAPRERLRQGDIALFSTGSAGDINHVGLYAGGGAFVHAPRTGDVVKLSRLSDPYFAQRYVGARRLG